MKVRRRIGGMNSGMPSASRVVKQYNLKDAAKMLNFLQANNIMDMTGLDEKSKTIIGEQLELIYFP